jgi:hypothetical protein
MKWYTGTRGRTRCGRPAIKTKTRGRGVPPPPPPSFPPLARATPPFPGPTPRSARTFTTNHMIHTHARQLAHSPPPQTRTHANTHTHACKHTHTHTHKHTHTPHARTRTHARACTHTHTHPQQINDHAPNAGRLCEHTWARTMRDWSQLPVHSALPLVLTPTVLTRLACPRSSWNRLHNERGEGRVCTHAQGSGAGTAHGAGVAGEGQRNKKQKHNTRVDSWRSSMQLPHMNRATTCRVGVVGVCGCWVWGVGWGCGCEVWGGGVGAWALVWVCVTCGCG